MHDHHHHHHHDDPHQDVPVTALLAYMTEHNHSHLHELEHVAEHMEGEAKAKLLEAVEAFTQGNARLAEALKLLEEKK